MKTKIVTILLCAIIGIMVVCSQLPTFTTASASSAVDINEADIAELEAYTEELNQTLAEYGTTADEQLEKLSNELNAQASHTPDGAQINNLKTLNRFTDELRACAIITCSDSDDAVNGLLDKVLEQYNQEIRNLITSFLSPAIGLLSLCGHSLTVELLLNGFIMQEVDEPYVPAYGYKVRQSEEFIAIANGNKTVKDKNEQPQFKTAYWGLEGDLYLAIHGFNYFKPYPSSKTVTITDTYDYDDSEEALKNFHWIFRPIIKGVCKLERNGLFTYYDIEITETYAKKIDVESDGYAEERPTIHENEFNDYEVCFSSDGRRLIQTFGDSETVLYVLDEDRKTLMCANGNGFNGNSLLSYNFKKNTTYILRVMFADKDKVGSIKLSVFCDTRYADSYDNLNMPKLDVGSYTASATAKSVYMATIAPEETNLYTIKFTPNTLYHAYLIDMSSTDSYSLAFCTSSSGTNGVASSTAASVGTGAGTLTVKLPPTIIEFPGGGGDFNAIVKTLNAGKQYLLIVCAYPANTRSLNVPFTITKS